MGFRVAIRLRGFRRMGLLAESTGRLHRVFRLVSARIDKRKDLTLQSGGLLLALVGPKASGKSTLGRELEARLGQYLDVQRIHAGKPPATALTMIFHLLIPFARRLFQNERPREYEKAERRREKRYSLVYVLHMTMLAHERYYLLRQAFRDATAGSVVISDRFPSATTGAIDSSCFDEEAIALCGSPLKRWLMQRERALYRRMPRPDLVIRLSAPLEMTIERDATRVKADKPDAAAVQRRRELETTTSFAGISEVVIDSSQPLDTTIRDVVDTVWRAL